MIEKTTGFIAAPLTAYRSDGSVNLELVPRYLGMLHANGVTGAFVNGTTGEGMSLTVKERCDLAERWVNAAPGSFRVIIHVGHTCQAESQSMASHAEKIGAYGIGEIGPVFFRPSSVETLVDYCAATAESAPSLPYYYYHMPSMSNVLFPMIEFLQAADTLIPNLAGIKYTYEDLDDYERCIGFGEGKYDILFGRDEILLDGLQVGTLGAVGSTYNIMAPLYHELVRAFREGDIEKAQRLQAISFNACQILADTGAFASALRAVMGVIGIDTGSSVRRPQINLSPDDIKELVSQLQISDAMEFLNIEAALTTA